MSNGTISLRTFDGKVIEVSEDIALRSQFIRDLPDVTQEIPLHHSSCTFDTMTWIFQLMSVRKWSTVEVATASSLGDQDLLFKIINAVVFLDIPDLLTHLAQVRGILHLLASPRPPPHASAAADPADPADPADDAQTPAARADALRALLEHGADVAAVDEAGRTALAVATDGACREELELGALMAKGWTRLMIEAGRGAVRRVRTLVSGAAAVNAANGEQRTALHYACEAGHRECVRLLVEGRAELNRKDMLGKTGLHLAAAGGHVDTVRLLITARANLNPRMLNPGVAGALGSRPAQQNYTPLQIAALGGQTAAAAALVAAGASLYTRPDLSLLKGLNASLEPPAMPDEWSLIHWAAAGGHAAALRCLLDAGAGDAAAAVPRQEQYTPLHWAASEGHVTTVRVLIDSNADVDALVKNAPIHLAAASGHLAVVDSLIEAGANVDAQNEDELGALHYAASRGHVTIVESLIRAAADVDIQNSVFVRPVHLAASAGHVTIVKLLIDSKPNPLHRIDDWDQAIDAAEGEVKLLLRRARTKAAAGCCTVS